MPRRYIVIVTLLVVCVLGVVAVRLLASPKAGPLTDPFLGTSELSSAMAAALQQQLEWIRSDPALEVSTVDLESAVSGDPIPIRMPRYGAGRQSSLRGFFGGSPLSYLAPVLVDDEAIAEYEVQVGESNVLDAANPLLSVPSTQYGPYVAAAALVREVLGDDAQVVFACRPTQAVLGWTSTSEAMVVVSVEDMDVAVPEGVVLRDQTAIDAANSLWAKRSSW